MGEPVRLLAGDPWLYATGPEEAQACAKAGVVMATTAATTGRPLGIGFVRAIKTGVRC